MIGAMTGIAVAAAVCGCTSAAGRVTVEEAGIPSAIASAPETEGACEGFSALKNPYFGDIHVHTSYSMDAFAFGTRKLTPADALRFARGAEIDHPVVGRMQLSRPLDFTVITDHAEYFDLVGMCLADPDNPEYGNTLCQQIRDDPRRGLTMLVQLSAGLADISEFDDAAIERGRKYIWRSEQNQVNAAHAPCHFSTLIGYEWTGGSSAGRYQRGNLHRNVVFAGDTVAPLPGDARRYPQEADLWRYLEAECKQRPGCDVIAIPHNSNLGRNGAMWAVEDADQAQMRGKFERLLEVYQHKGDSECDNYNLDPQDGQYDADCEFEKVTFANIPDAGLAFNIGENDRRLNTIRKGIGNGLAYWQANGFNPLEAGFIASSDTHYATPGFVEEQDFRGHHGELMEENDAIRLRGGDERGPGGLAVVWAEENTRKSIFSALHRRETYGTSGTRIELRFYATPGTGDYCADAAFPRQVASATGTVSMGGVLTAGKDGLGAAGPAFVVRARRDRTPLQRMQIIRLRVEAGGAVSERVTTIRTADSGVSEMCAVWRDADYAAALPAAYYARVLEQATPRWSSYACRRDPGSCEKNDDRTIFERAWSSPVWVYPQKP